jgi:hypothetical protein
MELFSIISELINRVPELARFLALMIAVYFISRILAGIFLALAEFFGTFRGEPFDRYAKPLGKLCCLLGTIFVNIGYGVPKRYREIIVLQETNGVGKITKD